MNAIDFGLQVKTCTLLFEIPTDVTAVNQAQGHVVPLRSHEPFENVYFGNLRLSGGEVLTLNGLINLVTMDGCMAWGFDTDFYVSSTNTEYRDFYVIAYDKAFIFLSCKYQHPCRYLRDIPCPAVKGA